MCATRESQRERKRERLYPVVRVLLLPPKAPLIPGGHWGALWAGGPYSPLKPGGRRRRRRERLQPPNPLASKQETLTLLLRAATGDAEVIASRQSVQTSVHICLSLYFAVGAEVRMEVSLRYQSLTLRTESA